jgi:hypothetical protein
LLSQHFPDSAAVIGEQIAILGRQAFQLRLRVNIIRGILKLVCMNTGEVTWNSVVAARVNRQT